MAVPTLGPKASFLLGMLAGTARTERELLRIAREGARLVDGVLDADDLRETYAVCGEIAVSGEKGIRRLLVRLERAGLAVSVTDPEGGSLWVARLPYRSPPD